LKCLANFINFLFNMNQYRADLHIHSVLSPCGDLSMSPSKIIEEALRKRIDILGISDHNSTHHCRLMTELGESAGILVLPGVEINTKEEIHCLAFFENADITDEFQKFLNLRLPPIPNNKELFGCQLVVDQNEQILFEVDTMLISALNATIYEVSEEVHRLGGIFIPAHIDRLHNSIISQLGFIPGDLQFEALEVSALNRVSDYLRRFPEFAQYTLISNSDAHYKENIGRITTTFKVNDCTFQEILMALRKENHRKTIPR
jgi:3',5'-nucleoside bisphosphate phosphatase